MHLGEKFLLRKYQIFDEKLTNVISNLNTSKLRQMKFDQMTTILSVTNCFKSFSKLELMKSGIHGPPGLNSGPGPSWSVIFRKYRGPWIPELNLENKKFWVIKISDKILERKYLSFFFAVFDLKILTKTLENLSGPD